MVPAQVAQKRWQGWQSWPLKYHPSSQVTAHRDPCRLKTDGCGRSWLPRAACNTHSFPQRSVDLGELQSRWNGPCPLFFLLLMPRMLLCACNKSVAYACAASLEDIPLNDEAGWHIFFFTQHFTTWRFLKVFYGPKQAPYLTICLLIPDLLDLLHDKCCSVTVYVIGICDKMNYTWIEGYNYLTQPSAQTPWNSLFKILTVSDFSSSLGPKQENPNILLLLLLHLLNANEIFGKIIYLYCCFTKHLNFS